MMLRSMIAASAAAILCFVAPAARAFEVTPFSFDLAPSGRGATQVVRVFNPGAEPIAIETSAKARQVDPAGRDTFLSADGDIAVFPPQAIAPARGTASFRVRYAGSPRLAASKDYVVFFNQMPLRADKAGSGVQVVMTFGASVHVTPPGAREDVRIEAVRPVGGDALEVTLVNAGTKYARIGDQPWTISCGAGRAELDRDAVRALAPAPLILPGARRTVRAPAPAQCRGAAQLRLELASR